MQWDRAKNFMLIFFLLANVMLAALIHYDSNSYTLTREMENAIFAVFSQNDIEMNYPIPRQFSPKRPLLVAGYDYDIERLLSTFFPPYAIEEIEHTEGANREVFTWEDLRLVISSGYIVFDSGLTALGVPDKSAAITLTQSFIREHYPDFRLDIYSTREVRRGLRIFYRQEYQGHLIHTNFVEFLVTGDGDDLIIEQVDIQYGRPLNFTYAPRELIGPDEALLTFVQIIRQQTDAPILITYMDIAYIQTSVGFLSETYAPTIYAEPVYRIFIDGWVEPFRINAFRN